MRFQREPGGRDLTIIAQRAGVPSEELEELCVKAIADGIPVQLVLSRIIGRQGINEPMEMHLLIEAMAAQAGRRGGRARIDTYDAGVAFMLSGRGGVISAARWRRWLVGYIKDQKREIQALQRLVKRAKKVKPGPRPPIAAPVSAEHARPPAQDTSPSWSSLAQADTISLVIPRIMPSEEAVVRIDPLP